MKKNNDRPIKSAVEELLKNYHLDEKMAQVKLLNSWEEIMGKAVSHRTTELIIRENKLYVSLSSASLRQELFQAREKILQLLNDAAGTQVITEVVFR
jgi:molybdopterin synthase catalytic subunit